MRINVEAGGKGAFVNHLMMNSPHFTWWLFHQHFTSCAWAVETL